MVAALRTEKLSKRFSRIQAVSNLDLLVEEGDIFGLLGPNGSGKTTALRLILRLVRPDSGRVEIFGRDVARHFLEVMRDIGSLIELPAYYPHLSAEKNLDLLRMATGEIPRSRIDEVLIQVGLLPRKGDRVRTYSQGMKQRLAIAMALLSNPRFVILDEPTNALDPQGVAEVRALIHTLNREHGVTFLLSSHLLYEMELLCTRVAIMRQGVLMVQDRVDRLLNAGINRVRIDSDSDRTEELFQKAKSLPYVTSVERAGSSVIAALAPADFARLNADIVSPGIPVRAFVPLRPTLEEVFLRS